jgi:Protein of unknown function (DUF1800)
LGDPPRARRTRPWSRGGPHRALAGVAVFKGSFDVAQAERLLWRAGFGPRRGEAEALARLGLDGAVHALTFPGDEAFVGPAPKDEKGRQLAPYDAWGHDHLWWLDRMVRTSRPLVCVTHPDHPSFFVDKLWSYFIPTAPDAATQRALQQVYVGGGRKIRPLVTAILKHPALHEGPRMVKSPTVFNAGLLRRLGRGVDTTAWAWLGSMAGQQLFYPPNVAGWDDSRWLDTATWRGRW